MRYLKLFEEFVKEPDSKNLERAGILQKKETKKIDSEKTENENEPEQEQQTDTDSEEPTV